MLTGFSEQRDECDEKIMEKYNEVLDLVKSLAQPIISKSKTLYCMYLKIESTLVKVYYFRYCSAEYCVLLSLSKKTR